MLSRCGTYDEEEVFQAVHHGINLLGGMARFVSPGQKVLLKANILRPVRPESAIITHPSILAAVARLVREAGGFPIIGDSPGGPFRKSLLKATYVLTGIEQAAKNSGAALNFDTSAVQVPNPDGKLIKLFDVIKAVVDADVVINMPKLKTHTLMHFTGAVKNLFGVVPGMAKPGYHGKLKNPDNFAQMLVDLAIAIKPTLVVMDAVVGMEGNGPSLGNPRQVGAIILGEDCTAVDLVTTALVGIAHEDVPTIIRARERGLFPQGLHDLEIIGGSLREMRVEGFKTPDTHRRTPIRLPDFLRDNLTGHLVWNPVPRKEQCTGCGICAQNCPVRAIEIGGRLAAVDLNHCIRCYCCHELCPEGAIELRRSALAHLASRLGLG